MLETFKGFLLFIVFLVPGFVFRTVEGQFVYLDKRLDWGYFALGLLTRSTFVYLPFAPLLHHAWRNDWIQKHPVWTGSGLLSFLVLLPLFLGFISGIGRQKQWPRKFIESLKIKTFEQHNIPTAWDYVFSQVEPGWVILTFKDGTKIYGWLGDGSYVSSDPDERDIYISDTLVPDDNGTLRFATNTKGIYVRAEDLRSMEFIQHKPDNEIP